MAQGGLDQSKVARRESRSRRVDVAHEGAPTIPRERDRVSDPAADSPQQPLSLATRGGAELQLIELTERLQARQSQLDRRESQLHAERADFESQCRAARLWIDERQKDIQLQQEVLRKQQKALENGESQLEKRRQELELQGERLNQQSTEEKTQVEYFERLDRDLSSRAKSLAHTEEELERKRSELEVQSDELDLERALMGKRREDLDAASAELESRHRQLDQQQAAQYRELERLTAQRCEIDKRQRYLDQREHELAASSAEMSLRAEKLDACSRQLAERAGELELQTAELARRETDLDYQVAELQQLQDQLDFRRREINTALRRFEGLSITEEKLIELRRDQHSLHEQRQLLERAGKLLEEQQAELAEMRRAFEAERLALKSQAAANCEASDRIRSDRESRLNEREEHLERREQELNRREEAVHALRQEFESEKLEVLEWRLAAEEMWMQLAGAFAPASAERALAQSRAKLNDQYRVAEKQLEDRVADLSLTRDDLLQMKQALVVRQQELERRLELRAEALDEWTDRLLAREKELENQGNFLKRQEAAWRDERASLQNQIRELLTRRAGELPAAA